MTHNLVFNDPVSQDSEVIVEPADGYSSSNDDLNVGGNVTSQELLHPPRILSQTTPSFSKDDYSNFLGKHRHISKFGKSKSIVKPYLLVIDNRVEYYKHIVKTIKKDVCCVVVNYETDNFQKLLSKISLFGETSFRTIGWLSHGYFSENVKLLGSEEQSSCVKDVQSRDPTIASWNPLKDFVTTMKTKYNIDNVDFISCNLASNSDYRYIFNQLEEQCGINIRASSEKVGSSKMGGKWSLENGKYDLKHHIFGEDVEKVNVVLPGYTSWAGSTSMEQLIRPSSGYTVGNAKFAAGYANSQFMIGHTVNKREIYVFERNTDGTWPTSGTRIANTDVVDYAKFNTSNRFGNAATINGTTLFLTDYQASHHGTNFGSCGVVFVFEYITDPNNSANMIWDHQHTLMSSSPSAYNFFGAAIRVTDDHIIVGAYADEDDTTDTQTGVVYTFSRTLSENTVVEDLFNNNANSGSFWVTTEQQQIDAVLDPSGGDVLVAGSHFGRTVIITGNTMVACASKTNTNGSDGGVVIYEYNPTTTNGVTTYWENILILRPTILKSQGLFGWSMTLTDDVLIVGENKATVPDSNNNNANIEYAGKVYSYTKPASGGWVGGSSAYQEIPTPTPVLYGFFGANIVLPSSTLMFVSEYGAKSNDSAQTDNTGCVYAYSRASRTDAWARVNTIYPPDSGVHFGTGMAYVAGLVGAPDSLMVGANFAFTSTNTNVGAIYRIEGTYIMSAAFVTGKVPNWLQPKSGQYSAALGGYESQFPAWCSPTTAANQLGHLVDHGGVTQPTNINDGIDAGLNPANDPFSVSASTITWDTGYGWGDYMLDGPTYRGKNLFNGVVSDFGWHMNTNNLGPLGAGAGSQVGTTIQNIYNGMTDFYQQVGYTNMVGMVYHFFNSIQTFGKEPAYWATTSPPSTAAAGASADYDITLASIKHEIDNNRTVIACFNGWNITSTAHEDVSTMNGDETGTYKTLGEYQPVGENGEEYNIPSTEGGNVESYNAGLGHTVLIVGYIPAGGAEDPSSSGNTEWLVVRDNVTTGKKNVIIPFTDLSNLLATLYVNNAPTYNAITVGGTDYGDSSSPTTLTFSNNTLTIENSIGTTDTDVVDFVLPAGYEMASLNVTNFTGSGTITYTLAVGGSTVTSGTFTATGANLLASNALSVTADTTYVLTLTASAAITYTIVGTKVADYGVVTNVADWTNLTIPADAKQLTISNLGATTGDDFGYSVAVDGNYAIVGAYKEDTSGADSGAAYIYERATNGTWNQVSSILKASNAGEFATENFGHIVAISGNYAIIGAPHEDTTHNQTGAVYIFERAENGTWGGGSGTSSNGQTYITENKLLRLSSPLQGDRFGYSVLPIRIFLLLIVEQRIFMNATHHLVGRTPQPLYLKQATQDKEPLNNSAFRRPLTVITLSSALIMKTRLILIREQRIFMNVLMEYGETL